MHRRPNLSSRHWLLLVTPQPLTGGETLRMGGAAMKFVPFCGAEFHW